MHSGTCSKLNSGTHSSKNVGSVMWRTIKKQKWLSAGIVCAVAGAILTALLPPLILGTIIDTMTTGNVVSFYLILAYFGFTLLMGGTGKFKGRTADCVRAENHARTTKQPDG